MQRRQFMAMIGGTALALGGCSASQDVAVANAGVARFRELMSEQKYAEIYAEGADELKKGSTEQQLTRILTAVNRRLGAVKDSKPNGWNVSWNNLITTVTVNFKTAFEKGTGEERFVFRISGGKALLTSYHISSAELIGD
jgi:hypothetical protein